LIVFLNSWLIYALPVTTHRSASWRLGARGELKVDHASTASSHRLHGNAEKC